MLLPYCHGENTLVRLYFLFYFICGSDVVLTWLLTFVPVQTAVSRSELYHKMLKYSALKFKGTVAVLFFLPPILFLCVNADAFEKLGTYIVMLYQSQYISNQMKCSSASSGFTYRTLPAFSQPSTSLFPVLLPALSVQWFLSAFSTLLAM